MNGVDLLDRAVLLSLPLLGLCWMAALFLTGPPPRIHKLYSFKVRMLWILPFSTRWRANTAPEHVEMIERFRGWEFGFLVASVVLAFLQFAYFKFFFLSLHSLP